MCYHGYCALFDMLLIFDDVVDGNDVDDDDFDSNDDCVIIFNVFVNKHVHRFMLTSSTHFDHSFLHKTS